MAVDWNGCQIGTIELVAQVGWASAADAVTMNSGAYLDPLSISRGNYRPNWWPQDHLTVQSDFMRPAVASPAHLSAAGWFGVRVWAAAWYLVSHQGEP
jgi:hypothetical protein